ncbi:MAG: hypothetical protein ACTSYL_00915 [Candidatus Thorarchaeota archaeon]
MSVRERKREAKSKKIEKHSSETSTKKDTSAVVSQTPIEMEPDAVLEELESTATVSATPVADIITPSIQEREVKPEVPLPSWGGPEESEWMYQIPPREEDAEMWTEEWADYLLTWAEATSTHVFSVATFIKEIPFKFLLNKTEAFKRIAEILVEKDVAEWMDRRRKQLRVYWRPLEDWVDIIYEWAMSTGNVRIDVKSIIIQESRQPFATLPEKDLYKILEMLIERGMAKWVDKKKGAIVISI